MFAKHVIKSLSPAITHVQRRGINVVSGPPQVRVSFAEKAVLCLVMAAGWTAIPVWVLGHIKEYKGQA
ncbi:CLUMA_CG020451, isoform A [Clunio marinus]|uniref:CLUMA_CG020451, isoform A n=1 Tax=Clunio marinus TaxID=568069 RepID=A0A1J1J4Z8_9DIPT|nr:CLUMA_CG020451, isoform A [Clunio marinus]